MINSYKNTVLSLIIITFVSRLFPDVIWSKASTIAWSLTTVMSFPHCSVTLLETPPVRHFRVNLTDEPNALHNISYVSEPPRAEQTLSGESLNRSHKSYQGIRDYLNIWHIPQLHPDKGWVFSMMEGLGPVAQARIALGLSIHLKFIL